MGCYPKHYDCSCCDKKENDQNDYCDLKSIEVKLEDIMLQLQQQKQKQFQQQFQVQDQDQDQNQAQVDTDTSNFENVGNPTITVTNDIDVVAVAVAVAILFNGTLGTGGALDAEAIRELKSLLQN